MYTFRRAYNDDGKEILELVSTVLNSYGLTVSKDSTDSDLSNLEENYFTRHGWFEVIEHDNRIIGSFGIYPVNSNTCELRKMYLHPQHQGNGLGKVMMETALEKARELGYSEMILETNSRLKKANELYTGFGFQFYTPKELSHRCDLALRLEL